MSERKGQETPDNMASDTQAEDEGEEGRTKENEYEPLKDIIESDQAVEPDAKVFEELKVVPEEEEEGSEKEKMVIAYATHKRQLVEHTISRRQHQRRRRQRRRK